MKAVKQMNSRMVFIFFFQFKVVVIRDDPQREFTDRSQPDLRKITRVSYHHHFELEKENEHHP